MQLMHLSMYLLKVQVLCRSRSLASVLDEYKYFPGLAVHWVMFGPDGREKRPEGGGVLRHYKSCKPSPETWIKTIVNSYYVAGAADHPHGSEFWCATWWTRLQWLCKASSLKGVAALKPRRCHHNCLCRVLIAPRSLVRAYHA